MTVKKNAELTITLRLPDTFDAESLRPWPMELFVYATGMLDPLVLEAGWTVVAVHLEEA